MIKDKIKEIAVEFEKYGMDTYYVGGCVRDEILGIPVDDYDICIVGSNNANIITNILERYDNKLAVNVGTFPVWIVDIDGQKVDFAMARLEKLVGSKRTNFEISTGGVTIEEDLSRRDLTINSIARNIITDEIIDPYGGIYDLEQRVARHTSEAFKDDTLRVIRAARFCSKFNLIPDKNLVNLCRELKPNDISNERVGMELMKVLKYSDKPSRFFEVLRQFGWLQYHFEELYNLIGIPQNPKHHPEGCAYTHTMYCIDSVPKGDWFMRATMLCHDLGKSICTTIDGNSWEEFKKPNDWQDNPSYLAAFKISSIGHEGAGVELTRNLLQRISFTDHKTIRRIACLVELHMIRAIINGKNYNKVIRKVLRKLMHYELKYTDLIQVVYYDLAGRPPKVPTSIEKLSRDMFTHHSKYLIESNSMKPIVTAEKLFEIGIEEGPIMGKILNHALELQDRGTLQNCNWKERLNGSGYKQYFKNSNQVL